MIFIIGMVLAFLAIAYGAKFSVTKFSQVAFNFGLGMMAFSVIIFIWKHLP